jgi:putative PIN family toxin of toxin-antitoxin system
VYRVVLDTTVIVAGLRSRQGASNALLAAVADRRLVPLATPPLFLEYEDVLKRPEQRLVHQLSLADVDAFLSSLASAIEPADLHFSWRPQVRDPDDEMVLETAINGRADALITFNERDFRDAASRFKLLVLTPGQGLRRIDK